jgi:hypothetical protein
MTKPSKRHDAGLSLEELQAEQATDLPEREALSTVDMGAIVHPLPPIVPPFELVGEPLEPELPPVDRIEPPVETIDEQT